MSENTVSRWKNYLQKRTLCALANAFWGEFQLKCVMEKEAYNYEDAARRFGNHLENIAAKIEKIKPYLSKLTDQLRYELRDAILHSTFGYWEAHLWEVIYPLTLPFTILNPMVEDYYKAGHFIDHNGHFNDLHWVKHFIADEDQSIHNRFELACLYCFEDDIKQIWHIMKAKRQLPCKGNLNAIKCLFDYIVALWAYKLQNKLLKQFEKDRKYMNKFNILGLKHSISHCYEHATKYFWKRCSRTEITLFVFHNDFLHELSNIARWKQVGLLYFIYSRITFGEKRNVIMNVTKSNKCMEVADIWECLIFSHFYESALHDIRIFHHCIPPEIFARLLTSLSCRIAIGGDSATYKIIFKILWNRWLKKEECIPFKLGKDIITNFSKSQEIDLLAIVIHSLCYYEKEMMLLDDWGRGGMSILQEFYNAGDYDLMYQYVLFFLYNQDYTTQKISLRLDALEFLDQFRKKIFADSTEKQISKNLKYNLEKVIENLQGSLVILHSVLEQF